MKRITEKLQSKVIELQNEIRCELENVRSQELSLYNLMRESNEAEDDTEEYRESIEELASDLNEHRKYLNNRSEEMSVTLKMAKETELKRQLLQETSQVNEPHSTRRTHLSFHEVQWNLNDKDGRIAHFVMKNFEYLSVASVDSVLHEQSNQQHVIHEFKIRDFELQNLLPDQIFRIVLQPEDRPTENTSHNYSAVRVLCKVKPPVNGLRIKEHIELNMKPMNLQVTKKFYKKIRLFFFPENDNQRSSYPSSITSVNSTSQSGLIRTNSDDSASDIQSTAGTISTRSKLIAKIRRNPNPSSNSGVNDDRLLMTEQAKLMAERAQKNHSFVYIKIPQGKSG